jgi:hypothetical protein
MSRKEKPSKDTLEKWHKDPDNWNNRVPAKIILLNTTN